MGPAVYTFLRRPGGDPDDEADGGPRRSYARPSSSWSIQALSPPAAEAGLLFGVESLDATVCGRVAVPSEGPHASPRSASVGWTLKARRVGERQASAPITSATLTPAAKATPNPNVTEFWL